MIGKTYNMSRIGEIQQTQTLTSLRKVDTQILSKILNTSEVSYELGSALIFHMNKTFKQFVEGMLPKTEKGINNAMKKGLNKLDQKYQKEYEDMKYPLDKKAQNVWKIWCKALGQKEGKNNREADAVAVVRTLILLLSLIHI